MADATQNGWWELCAQATVEQDPEKLRMMVNEFTRLLTIKENDNHKLELQNYKRSV